MNIIKCFFLLLSLWFYQNLQAQKQNNQWRFGNGGGINFNTVPPVFISGAAINTPEGSASVSDKNTGELLFYTDGVSVWNANNQLMPNGTGLLGGSPTTLSSTTAAVIIPRPGSNNLYYIVTIDEQASRNGVNYSVVDMSLSGGLGDIVATQKNISLFQTTSEKLEVVPASDGVSYWLLTHDEPGNSFYAYKITATGIQSTPVISTVGATQGNGAGHMKINRQFNKLAIGVTFGSVVELYDFNNSTGVVSNPISWSYNLSSPLIYGIEFSPDGKRLYISNLDKLLQYDISQTTASAIQNSLYQFPTGFTQPASLQLAPNDKIYINSGNIDVINCPNKLGASCGYQQNAIANQTGGGGYGLPKWVYYAEDTPAVTSNSINYRDTCFGNATQFSIRNIVGISSVTWNFGDPTSGVNNTAVGFTASHTFSQVGNYIVFAVLNNACGTDTLFVNGLSVINCSVPPAITGIKLVGDTCTVPSILSLQAVGTSNSPYFFWNFGDPASGVNDTITITGLSTSPFPTHTFSSAGVYTVCVSFQEPGFPVSTVCRRIFIGLCCNGIIASSDSCLQNSIPFSILTGATITNVNWNFGDPSSGSNNTSIAFTPTHVFSQTGPYNVTANIVATCGSFQINYPLTIVNCSPNCTGTIVSNDTCLLNGTSFQVESVNTINNIDWDFDDVSSGTNNSSTSLTPRHQFSTTGTYNIRAIVNFSCGVDTINKTISIKKCDSTATDCELIVPNAFTPNGDGKNDKFYAVLNCPVEEYNFMIYNRWGQLVFTTSNLSGKWDGKYKGADCPTGIYVYLIKYKFPRLLSNNAKGTISLIR